MNTQYLEEFLAFSETPNYSVTAKRLYITRPTLAEHIHALEAELGCKLVQSGQNNVELTQAGKLFVQSARDLLDQWRRVRQTYGDLERNLLTVTISTSNLPWLETLLYEARRNIHAAYPHKRIDIVSCEGAFATTAALEDGTNDIVVAGRKSYLAGEGDPFDGSGPDGFRGFLLGTEEIKMLMTDENRLFQAGEIRVADLDGMTFMLPPDIYDAWLRDGMVGRFAQMGARIELRTLVIAGHSEYFNYDFGEALGIVPTTLVPRFGIDSRPEFRTFTLTDWTVRTDFYAVCRADFAESENGGLLFAEMERIARERREAAGA